MVRTRFAPSPTGSLHVGNARIAVLNWIFTRNQRGTFILRIEDTDLERNVRGAERQLMQDLEWLGLHWDEGPMLDGPEIGAHGPYRQSERLHLYREYADRLLATGQAFHCYCLPADLEAARESAIELGLQAQYPGTCRNATADQIAQWRREGRTAALRFYVPPGRTIQVHDLIYGDVEFRSEEISDFIIQRSDGLPTYNFAVVVDDILMEITHVVRGVGHLSNTPRQLVLYEALKQTPPLFAHVPTVLGPDRQKLSKRHGAQALAEYRAQGYHPEGVSNYLSLLGWSSTTGEEFLTREQLVREISLERVGNADVVFDPAKLNWLSGKHIEAMPLDELVAAVRPHIDAGRFQLDDETLRVAVAATRTHLSCFSAINSQLASFYPESTATLDEGRAVIETARRKLRELEQWDEAALTAAIKQIGGDVRAKGRALYEPLRRALTGREHGPPLPAVMIVQGRERVLQQLDSATGE